MKILHLIDSGGMYGAENVVISLMKAQRQLENEPVLGSIGDRGSGVKEIEQIAEAAQLGVQRFRMRKGPDLLGGLRIWAHAEQGAFDLVHTHGYKADILMGLVAKRQRSFCLIATVHGWTSVQTLSRLWLYEWLHRKMLRAMDAVVVVSEPLFADPRLKRIRKKLHIIRNGMAVEPDCRRAETLADPITSFAQDAFVIATVGRLSREKDHKSLLTAFKLFLQAGVPAKLVIIGDGPERGELLRAVSRAGLDNAALIAGYRSDAKKFLPLFDVFVLPSMTEGTPITLLEAMEEGVPVVATAVGGVPELLDHGAAGIVVEPGIPESITHALLSLHRSPELGRKLAQKARERVEEKYSIQACAQSYQDVYEKILADQQR